MALKDIQTQIITQFPDAVTGQIVGFIAASLRVYDATNPTSVSLLGSVAMTLRPDATIIVSSVDSNVLFITDGSSITNILYSVSVTDFMAPTILDSLGLV